MLPWRGKAKHEPDRLRHSYGRSDWILQQQQQQGYGPGHLMGTWSAKAKRPSGVRRNWITFIGYALIVLVTAVSTLVRGEALFVVHLIVALAVVMGSIFLGAMTLRARVLPWWCGVLLLVGFPFGDVLDSLVARGSEGIVLAILWELVGYALLAAGR
jgi:hypothetical protein